VIAKRVFDVATAGLGLVLLAPLFVVVAAWIKLDSPGPVFFRQERIGRGGVPFRIHKFRTMRVGPRPRDRRSRSAPIRGSRAPARSCVGPRSTSWRS
jgi:lipopolysaccharide/colanic/teichoic acid biosynthesis glycosyltransferase